MNQYLEKRRIKVANVVYVSIKQRILVEKYLGGISVGEIAKDAVNQSTVTASQLDLFESLGTTLATIHRYGVSIGDTKPENFIASGQDLFVVDLEQASKRGDYSWDIAELLFYTGHYCSRPAGTASLRQLVEAFVDGYLQKGKSVELRKAAAVKHAKAFSIWTPPPVILEISRTLHAAK